MREIFVKTSFYVTPESTLEGLAVLMSEMSGISGVHQGRLGVTANLTGELESFRKEFREKFRANKDMLGPFSVHIYDNETHECVDIVDNWR